jgi:ABC-type amino acid transport substrate-binding protein
MKRLLLSWFLLAGCASSLEGERFVAASDLDNAPFAFVQSCFPVPPPEEGMEDGFPDGRDVAMTREVFQRLGAELEWSRRPFDQLLDAVEAGEVDLVVATLGVTPEREERVLFSRPYFRTAIAVVARTGEGEPTRLAELGDRRVAASKGTTSERALRKLLYVVPVLENEKGLPAIQRLTSGDVDALVMDGPAADALVASSNGALRRLEDLDQEHYAIAIDPAQPELKRAIDRVLRELEAEGWLDELDARYGLPPSAR